jgi:hypothetical protein
MVVAPELVLSPCSAVEDALVQCVGTRHPAACDVDPRPLIQPHALELDLVVDHGVGKDRHEC